jgi:selenocysteine lyase/cysteine desulfurase
MPEYAEFIQKYPTYDKTHDIDELRDRDYARLDRSGQVYLDYTGGGLYSDSQMRLHQEVLAGNIFGNPHSSNPTSQATTRLIENTRLAILQFFNADPGEYTIIFAQNASGALKLVGESYPFEPGGRYLLTFDNHNSVNGIREFAHAKGAEVTYIPIGLPDMRVDMESLKTSLDLGAAHKNNLFAYPAQSNFSGVQHPLEWIERAHAKGWDVLPILYLFRSTRSSVTPPASERWWPAANHSGSYTALGSPAGRSPSPPSRGINTTWPRLPPLSKMEPSTISTFLPWKLD